MSRLAGLGLLVEDCAYPDPCGVTIERWYGADAPEASVPRERISPLRGAAPDELGPGRVPIVDPLRHGVHEENLAAARQPIKQRLQVPAGSGGLEPLLRVRPIHHLAVLGRSDRRRIAQAGPVPQVLELVPEERSLLGLHRD